MRARMILRPEPSSWKKAMGMTVARPMMVPR